MGKLNKPRGRVGAGFTRTESTKTVDGRKLLGNVELSRAITRAGVPRGVAVASIARLPSSTDDPSGSPAGRSSFFFGCVLCSASPIDWCRRLRERRWPGQGLPG